MIKVIQRITIIWYEYSVGNTHIAMELLNIYKCNHALKL